MTRRARRPLTPLQTRPAKPGGHLPVFLYPADPDGWLLPADSGGVLPVTATDRTTAAAAEPPFDPGPFRPWDEPAEPAEPAPVADIAGVVGAMAPRFNPSPYIEFNGVRIDGVVSVEFDPPGG